MEHTWKVGGDKKRVGGNQNQVIYLFYMIGGDSSRGILEDGDVTFSERNLMTSHSQLTLRNTLRIGCSSLQVCVCVFHEQSTCVALAKWLKQSSKHPNETLAAW